MTENIKGEDVIKLILQFCRENDLKRTYRCLQEETGVVWNFVKNTASFESYIRSAKWSDAISEINDLTLSRATVMEFFEVLVFELLASKEYDLARHILKEVMVKKRLNEDFLDRYNLIQEIVTSQKFNSDKYYEKESKEKKRDNLTIKLREEINLSKPGRLLHLLSEAIKSTKEHSSSKSLMEYDIFKNEYIPFTDLEDSPPNTIGKTVRFQPESKPTAAWFTANGQYLVLGMSDGYIELWDPITKTLSQDIAYQRDNIFINHPKQKQITALCSTKDSKYLASADADSEVRVWRVEKGATVKVINAAHKMSVGCMMFSVWEEKLITAAYDIKVWGLKSGRIIDELSGHEASITGLQYYGDLILSGSLDGTIKVWSLKTSKEKLTIRPFEGKLSDKTIGISNFFLLENEDLLVCSESDFVVKVSLDGNISRSIEASSDEIVTFTGCTVSNHRKYSYCTTTKNYIYYFNLESNKLEFYTKVSESPILLSIHHPEKNMITIINESGEVIFLNS